MFELMTTSIGFGILEFVTNLLINNSSFGTTNFNIGNVNTNISYNAKLDKDRKNFHITIDIDINRIV